MVKSCWILTKSFQILAQLGRWFIIIILLVLHARTLIISKYMWYIACKLSCNCTHPAPGLQPGKSSAFIHWNSLKSCLYNCLLQSFLSITNSFLTRYSNRLQMSKQDKNEFIVKQWSLPIGKPLQAFESHATKQNLRKKCYQNQKYMYRGSAMAFI